FHVATVGVVIKLLGPFGHLGGHVDEPERCSCRDPEPSAVGGFLRLVIKRRRDGSGETIPSLFIGRGQRCLPVAPVWQPFQQQKGRQCFSNVWKGALFRKNQIE